jgi:hypothetical protein
MSPKKKGPKCGKRMIPVVYGFPGPGMIRKAERGEFHMSGCLINPGNPCYDYNTCAKEHVRASK